MRLFVYGSLLTPEVLHGLLNRVPACRPATLRGFSRWRVAGENFPAILQTPGGSVDGKLLEDLNEREMGALDYYEDEAYERLTVDVDVVGGSTVSEVNVYVWPLARSAELDVGGEPWRLDEFRETVEDFVADVVIPCRQEYEAELAAGASPRNCSPL